MKQELENKRGQDANKHYSVPEGYFENLTEQILAKLPQEQTEIKEDSKKGQTISMRYYKYAAAAVAVGTGIFLAAHFINFDKSQPNELLVSSNQSSIPLYETSNEEDADFLEYLENNYSDALIQDEWIGMVENTNE